MRVSKFSLDLSEVEKISQNWGWFFSLGLMLIALGIALAVTSSYATVFSIILFGILLIGAGAVQIIQAFLARKWSGLFLALLLGVLYLVTGFLLAARPATAPVSISLWIAAFCFIAGLFKMITALILQFEKWGWVFFNGLVTFLLGVVIYTDWPVSGLWLVGLFVGIDMILSGWSWIVLSLTARNEAK